MLILNTFIFISSGDENGSPEDTLEFQLKIKCTKNPSAPKDATDPDELYKNTKGMLQYETSMNCIKAQTLGSVIKASFFTHIYIL